ncbi:MAG: helix-turn-helix transcriptional regulator [Bacteroidales bacterium]|nr:helix-turn-helix transcriptional regulator [Bacteroidales bacterium]
MKVINIDSIQAFNDYHGVETLHPLVSVINFEGEAAVNTAKIHFGIYVLFLKETKGCKLSYGRTPYDFDEMTVTSFAPGQTVIVEDNPDVPYKKVIALAFHPDFLKRTPLGQQIGNYNFFNYSSNEALHLSSREIETYRNVVSMIESELDHNIDKYTHKVIVSNIQLLLDYCLRFYDRQFVTRELINHSVVLKFEQQLNAYLDKISEREGLPTVQYFADKCCLTSSYFSELVKAETGLSAKVYINEKLLSKAKELLSLENLSIQQVSSRLGFKYVQHFTRFFKTQTNLSPKEWRLS